MRWRLHGSHKPKIYTTCLKKRQESKHKMKINDSHCTTNEESWRRGQKQRTTEPSENNKNTFISIISLL